MSKIDRSQQTMSFSSKSFPCLIQHCQRGVHVHHTKEKDVLGPHVRDHRICPLREEESVIFLGIGRERITEAAR